ILRAPVMAGIGAILLVGGVTVWELERREKPAPPLKKEVASGSAPRAVVAIHPARQPAREVAWLEHAIVPPELPLLQREGPTETQLLETEVEAWWLLHRAAACNGEPIEIKRDDD